MRPRLILWDVMDTLLRDPFREVMPAFFGLSFRELLRCKSPTAWVRFERGEIDEATYFATAFADGRSFDGPGFRDAMVTGAEWLPGMRDVLEGLRAQDVSMVALSNYPCWYERLDARFGLSALLDPAWVSYRTGHRKPAAEAYLAPARAYGAQPGECVFVDDRAENVEAARALGLAAVQFEDASQVRMALAELGCGPDA